MLVPVDDPEAMAQAMLTMLDKAATYDRQTIREHIIRHFGRDAVCDALVKACEDACRWHMTPEEGVPPISSGDSAAGEDKGGAGA